MICVKPSFLINIQQTANLDEGWQEREEVGVKVLKGAAKKDFN